MENRVYKYSTFKLFLMVEWYCQYRNMMVAIERSVKIDGLVKSGEITAEGWANYQLVFP